MAITVENEMGQQNLPLENLESHEEKLTRYYAMDKIILELEGQKKFHQNKAAVLTKEIQNKVKDKIDLRNNIDSGEGIIIPVAVSSDSEGGPGEGDDFYPSEEELAEVDQDSDSQAEETEGETSEEGEASAEISESDADGTPASDDTPPEEAESSETLPELEEQQGELNGSIDPSSCPSEVTEVTPETGND